MYIVEVVASCVSAAEVAGLSLWPQGEGGHVVDRGGGGKVTALLRNPKCYYFVFAAYSLQGSR